MSHPRYQLTPGVQALICSYIRAGGYPHVAAEAAGIPADVFERWLQRARIRRPRKKYRLLYEAVIQAQAQVRIVAEQRALQKDALAWLKFGPGKETPQHPGWTNPAKASLGQERGAINLLLERETQTLLTTLLQVLQPFPEARAAVAKALCEEEGEAP